jgi:hypothetical protein
LHKDLWVNTPGKTLKGKPTLELILLIKILGSHPGIMAHLRKIQSQAANSLAYLAAISLAAPCSFL